ncbi:MAG: hypothetical protein JNK82_09180, partial [Myxococcaceae bacterium]|nr:hypothetical protein [Myxococcaceae bacterium]
MTRHLLAAALCLLACTPDSARTPDLLTTDDAQPLRRLPITIGGLTLDAQALATALVPAGGSSSIITTPHPVFALLTPARHVATSLSVLSVDLGGAAVVVIGDGEGRSATLRLEPLAASTLKVKVLAHSAGVVGVAFRLSMPADAECPAGEPGYVHVHHHCTSPRGTVASFCASDSCDNRVTLADDTSGTGDPLVDLPRVGAELTQTSFTPLAGAELLV